MLRYLELLSIFALICILSNLYSLQFFIQYQHLFKIINFIYSFLLFYSIAQNWYQHNPLMSSLKQKKIKDIWKKAKYHEKSSRVGIPNDLQEYHICECCDQPINKQPISLGEHTKQFEIFGFGYPLYFSYLKYCILLVVVLIASKTSTMLYMATKQNYNACHTSGHLPTVNSHGETKPHHYEATKDSLYHFSLRRYGDHALNFNLQLNAQQNSHQESTHNYFHHAKTQTPKTSTTSKQTEEKQSEQSYSDKPKAKASEQGTHSGGHSKKQLGDHSEQGNHKGNTHHNECTSFMIYVSLFVGEDEYNNYFLRIVSFLVHLLALIGIRNILIKEEQYYDERTCSLSDYSIMVSNLPRVYGSGALVRNFLRQEFDKDQEVKKLIYVFENEKIKNIQKKIHGLKEKQLKAIENKVLKQSIQEQIHTLQSQLNTQITSLRGDINRDYINCDKIIVILNSEKDKAQVLAQYQDGLKNRRDFFSYFKHISSKVDPSQLKVKIKEAPEPNQIIWEHIDQSDIDRKKYILLGWILTILFLALVAFAFYNINVAKSKLFEHVTEILSENQQDFIANRNKNIATVIIFITLFSIVLFNKFIMGKVLHYFVHLEKHAYTDQEGHSFALKYALCMFFTTALMTLAVEAITLKNFHSHPYGVIEEETIMFFVTAFFIPLVWLIHPYNMVKKIERYFKKGTLMTQEKANKLMEDFHYDLGKRYAEIFEIIWFTFLYSQLIPLGSFLILIGLVLYYWIDKYNFLRRSALKEGLSGKITILSLKSMDATLFVAPAGRALFDYYLHDQIDYLSIVMTAIGLIYLLMPISSLIWHFNQEKFFLEQKTYDQAKQSFKEHYYTLHPVYRLTHKKDNQNFRKKVVEHHRKQMKKGKLYGAGRGHFTTAKNNGCYFEKTANSTIGSRLDK